MDYSYLYGMPNKKQEHDDCLNKIAGFCADLRKNAQAQTRQAQGMSKEARQQLALDLLHKYYHREQR